MTKGPKNVLGPTLRSDAADVAEALASLVPFAGGLFQKTISRVVNDRNQRAEHFIALLTAKLVEVGALGKSDQLTDEEVERLGIDPHLFADAVEAASRARTAERLNQLAAIIAGGFGDQETTPTVAQRFVRMLADIDDEAVVVLCSFHPEYRRNDDFRKRHAQLLASPHIDEETDLQYLRVAAAYRIHIEQLKSHGLLYEPGTYGGGVADNPSYDLTSIGSEFLMACGLTKGRALRYSVQRKFAEQVLHAYESLRDSAAHWGELIDPMRAEFLGFNQELEPQYIAYCDELYGKNRWESLRPKPEHVALAKRLGRMARLYKHVVDKFVDEKDRDYRTHPLGAQDIFSITYEVTQALEAEGLEFSDGI